MTTLRRTCQSLALGAAITTASLGGVAQAAADPSVPNDVVEFLSGPAITEIQADVHADDQAPDELSGELEAVAPRAINVFSDSFYAGATDDPLTESGEWIAALTHDDAAVGTVRVWKPSGTVEIAQWDNDAELAASLIGADDASEHLIEDAPLAAFYVYNRNDKSIGPANAPAKAQVFDRTSLAEVQAAVLERTSRGRAADGPDVVGGQGPTTTVGNPSLVPLVWGSIALASGLALLAVWFVGRRRTRTRLTDPVAANAVSSSP